MIDEKIPERKETVGQIVTDLLAKSPESTDPIEIQRATEKEYLDNLAQCVETNKKHYSNDFFIVVITKAEKLMPNVFRNYFFARKSCPMPNYDQTVYIYNSKMERIEYIWSVPCRDTVYLFGYNRDKIDPSEYQLLQFVLDFMDGTLDRLCVKYNNEIEKVLLKG